MGLQQRLKIIQFILANNIRIINPRIEYNSIKYDILDKLNMQDSTVLDELFNEGMLKKKVFATVIKCPTCGSFFISSFYKCPFCNSTQVEYESIVTHNTCGYTGPFFSFKEYNKLICPLCKNEINKSEISIRANIYLCKNCGRNFLEGKIIHYCNQCGNKFEPEANLGSIETIYAYEIDNTSLEKINKKYKPWIEIYDFLIEFGFNIKEVPKIKGESGVEHEFDLVVEKEGKFVAFSFLSKVTMEDMLRHYIRVIDTKNASIFIVTESLQDRFVEEAKKRYGINLISLQGEDVAKKLERQLRELHLI